MTSITSMTSSQTRRAGGRFRVAEAFGVAALLSTLALTGGCAHTRSEAPPAAEPTTPVLVDTTAGMLSEEAILAAGKQGQLLASALRGIDPERPGFNTKWKPPEVQGEKPSAPFAVIGGKVSPAPSIPMGDRGTIRRIINEGKKNPQTMAHLRHLSEVIGARLTASTRLEQANTWTRDQFAAWGLDAKMEQWGTAGVRFDRGPSSGRVLIPSPERSDPPEPAQTLREVQFTAWAWSGGTNGPTRGRVVKMPKDDAEFAAMKDQLQGAWVLLPPPKERGQRGVRNPMRARWEARADAAKKVAEGTDPATLPLLERLCYSGVLGFIATSRDERVWTTAVPGWRDMTMATLPKTVEVVVRQSDYDAINSRLFDEMPVEAEFDLQHTFTPGPVPLYNTVAAIRGTTKPDEYIIVSGHLDSWDGPGSQGTIDNATGSAVTMEAARLLMAANAKPDRTILFILWTGEEQGLLGARAYVDMHKDKLPRISAMFNDDGGTNYQGGLPAAEQMVPYLAAATAPVNQAFPTMTVNIRPTGKKIETHASSDHAAFNAVGVPGFYWDEVGMADYGYGWHTQHDRFNLAIEEYLTQSAVNSAVVAYQLACAPELLPRSEASGENASVSPMSVQNPQGQNAAPAAPAPAGAPSLPSGVREVAPSSR